MASIWARNGGIAISDGVAVCIDDACPSCGGGEEIPCCDDPGVYCVPKLLNLALTTGAGTQNITLTGHPDRDTCDSEFSQSGTWVANNVTIECQQGGEPLSFETVSLTLSCVAGVWTITAVDDDGPCDWAGVGMLVACSPFELDFDEIADGSGGGQPSCCDDFPWSGVVTAL